MKTWIVACLMATAASLHQWLYGKVYGVYLVTVYIIQRGQ